MNRAIFHLIATPLTTITALAAVVAGDMAWAALNLPMTGFGV